MTPDLSRLRGHRMTDDEIDRLLERVGVGVLSLARDDEPYGLPLAFGYDGDRCYFVFVGHSEAGRKVTFAERAARASFLAHEVADTDEWRSTIVAGPIDRIEPDRWDTAREALADNAYQADLFTEIDRLQDPRVWALTIEERSGRAMVREAE